MLTCNSATTILPDRTMCRTDDDPFPCKIKSNVIFSLKILYKVNVDVYMVKHRVTVILYYIGEPFTEPIPIRSTAVHVTAINCVGQTAALQVTFHYILGHLW